MCYDSIDYSNIRFPRNNACRYDKKANIILSSDMYFRLMKMFPTMSFSAIVRYILNKYLEEFEKDGD